MNSTIELNTSVDNHSKISMLEVILEMIRKFQNSTKPAEASFYFSSIREAYVRFYGTRKYNNIWHYSKGWTSAARRFEEVIRCDIQYLRDHVFE